MKNLTQKAQAREQQVDKTSEYARDWRKSMSDHVAYALLVYTGLQIFVTVKALTAGSSSILPYFGLIALVAGAIPVCRWFEKRWSGLSDSQAADEAYHSAFKTDIFKLWLLAIVMPFIVTGCFKAITFAF